MSATSQVDFVFDIMTQGFKRASDAFSRVTKRHVRLANTQVVIISKRSGQSFLSEKEGELSLVLTKIIGDIPGKSYLILDKEEKDEILARGNHQADELLNNAFLKEIDNIISASVISELANSLKLDIYGDVPKLMTMPAEELEEYMLCQISEEDSVGMIMCKTTFLFENQRIQPQFVWKISEKIFEMIPAGRITV